MGRFGRRAKWSPELATPSAAVAGGTNAEGMVIAHAGGICRVCGKPITQGQNFLHLRWDHRRAHLDCGWLTAEERKTLAALADGVPSSISNHLCELVARGYMRASSGRQEITDSGRRALERGW